TADRKQTVSQRVRAIVAELLLLPPNALDEDMPLVDLGMDSVTGLSLIDKLEASFSVRIHTNELLLLGTISRIARRLEGGADKRAGKAVRIPIRSTPEAQVDMVLFPGAGGT